MHRALSHPVTVEVARAKLFEEVRPLGAERVPLGAARGRILAEDLVAPFDHPPRDDSAMDGYAVRRADLAGASASAPVRLRVARAAAAPGMPEPPALAPGEAVRIYTGGPVPTGADAIVRQEAVGLADGEVLFRGHPEPGENIRRAGEDVAAGALLLCRGAVLHAGELTALAAMGRAEVNVLRRPRVALVTTGDELCAPGRPRRPGQIYDANAAGLAAMVEEAGGIAVPVGPVPDDRDALRDALGRALANDAVCTAAGISVGDRDHVAETLESLGAEWRFRGVRMKPGKPLSFGRCGPIPLFALPGNPAAALVAFEVFVGPFLRRLAGHAGWARPRVQAILEKPVAKRGGATYFVRGVARAGGGALRFVPLDRQGVGMLTSMIGHNALAELSPERTEIEAGEPVTVHLLGAPLAAEPPPMVAFAGPSGAGKTRLLVDLIGHLRARGIRVGALKHDVHGFEMDREGKDTWRFARAGAVSVAIVGPERVGAILDERAPPLAALLARLFPACDLVLAEGFHDCAAPLVLVLGGRPPEARDVAAAARCIAVVGGALEGIPSLEASDLGALAARVLAAAGMDTTTVAEILNK